MEIKTVQTGERPKLRIESVGGRLRVRGGEAGRVEARAPDGSELRLEQRDGGVWVSASTECQLLVPAEASVEAETVGGEAWITDLAGELLIRTVGGSLRLKQVGSAAIETIGGSLAARRLSGKLSVDRIGGDALVDQVAGDLRLRAIGGDLRLSRSPGVIDVSAGGDGKVSLEPAAGTVSSIRVGGDLSGYVAEPASALLKLQAGGDLRLEAKGELQETPPKVLGLSAEGQQLRIGAGEAEVRLTAGGDLTLRSGQDAEELAAADLGEAIAMRVGAELETHMAEIEGRLSGLGDRLQGFDSERIGRKIRSSIARAQRKAARAQRRAARRRELHIDVPTRGSRGEPSDEERLMILRMVEQRKISVDEAESLLQALED